MTPNNSQLVQTEKQQFLKTLDTLYWKSKLQRREGFKDISKIIGNKCEK